jgi:hypothetical protein
MMCALHATFENKTQAAAKLPTTNDKVFHLSREKQQRICVRATGWPN